MPGGVCTTTLNAKTKDITLNVILNKDFRRPIELIGIWPINMGAAPKRKLELTR